MACCATSITRSAILTKKLRKTDDLLFTTLHTVSHRYDSSTPTIDKFTQSTPVLHTLLISRNRIVDINNVHTFLISRIRIVDIQNLNSWYQQFDLLISIMQCRMNCNCWYQEFEFLISTIRILDINNTNSWYQQLNYWYQEIKYWYQQFIVDISKWIVDISNSIVDIKNSNCWYQECGINVNSACHSYTKAFDRIVWSTRPNAFV